jgi:uncharacterized cupin superfamily protein
MEVAPGVFVSATSTDEWQPHAHPAGELHVLCRGVGLNAGLWRSVPGSTPQPLLPWTAPSREAKIVLAGTARVEIEDGPTLELKAGDIASLPEGSTSTWWVSDDYSEFWILDDLGAGD